MGLTQFSVQHAKPRAKPYKLADGNGLHLLVQPNGSKLRRLRCRFGGTQRRRKPTSGSLMVGYAADTD
jgi:hypothetical protein